ncbi:MAG TPA: hypothetical protein VFO31_30370 [Vicinamibacterales bacterium]|nr:hypothetical protein [Vicinamibacterales bacterium]
MVRKMIACGLAVACSLQLAVPAWAGGRRLPDGTRIPVRTMEPLSSATLKDNDPVTFAVVEDVVVDGEVVIKQGTPVRGTIVDAEAKRRMGRAGKLQYTVNETKGVDRSVIRLRALQDRKGDSNVTSTAVTTVAVGVFVPVAAPFFLLRKGHDIVVPEGTRVDTFVDGDHLIGTENEPAASVAVAAATSAPAPAQPRANGLTNADIIALKQAGFSDEVVLAKIAASPAAYNLAPTEMVALKKSGVSERVITAMVAAK